MRVFCNPSAIKSDSNDFLFIGPSDEPEADSFGIAFFNHKNHEPDLDGKFSIGNFSNGTPNGVGTEFDAKGRVRSRDIQNYEGGLLFNTATSRSMKTKLAAPPSVLLTYFRNTLRMGAESNISEITKVVKHPKVTT